MAKTIADLLNDLKINHSIKADHPFLNIPISSFDECHYSDLVTIMWLYGEHWIDQEMLPSPAQLTGQESHYQEIEFYNLIKAEVMDIIGTSPEERNPRRLRSMPPISRLTVSGMSCFISQNPVHQLLSEKLNGCKELTFRTFWVNRSYSRDELQCSHDSAPIPISSRDYALLQQMRELVTKVQCKVIVSSSEPNLYLLEHRAEHAQKMFPEQQLRTGRRLSSRTRTFFSTGEFIFRRVIPAESETHRKFNELKGFIADEQLKELLSFETMDDIVTAHAINYIAIAEFIKAYALNSKEPPPSGLLKELLSITHDAGNFELIVGQLARLFFDLEKDINYPSQMEQLDGFILKLNNEVGADELAHQWIQLQMKGCERFKEMIAAKLSREERQSSSKSMGFS